MSVSLLRKGLDLLDQDESGKRSTSKKGNPGRNPKEFLSSKKTGVKKQLQRLKQGNRQTKNATIKGRVVQSAVEAFKKNREKDHLRSNLKYMLGSRTVANKEVVKKILQQNEGRKARDRQIKQQEKIKENSVFSDADFKRFELEYFGSR
ncbi:hypothetical protein GDO86_007444 [Hymenochirus boettgeri]|uniref:Active regulator of SIRT1 n=1 Tax=Hymenochirus boettgeri TaxID=247094 RepID=A0A8T2J1V1_9PIPI|nr:hypothetical protein GDO86_007444 [Hymenochirus boettgeri]KAG8436346.1 hypothetical protein GDO86_007444 [Hymenochirus boettgeri]